MDDTKLRTLFERLGSLRNLEKRRGEILSSIEGQGLLTDELRAAVMCAATLSEVEDLYLPFRPKRRTRASVAREKGLEPLALRLLAQEKGDPSPSVLASDYVNAELGVASVDEALSGASDIVAETVSDSADARKLVRERMNIVLQSSGPYRRMRRIPSIVSIMTLNNCYVNFKGIRSLRSTEVKRRAS